jgi:hypothetical protein
MLIKLICCGVPSHWPIIKNIVKSSPNPPRPQVEITDFTILHGHVKPCNYI